MNKISLKDAIGNNVFHNAIFCSYLFNPQYFEEVCLDKYNSLKANNNISVIIDQDDYDNISNLNNEDRPKLINTRYLLVPYGENLGVFHPKIYLLANEKNGRLIIGSANCTKPGLNSNAELLVSINYDEKNNKDTRFIFQECFEFITKISRFAENRILTSNINKMRKTCEWLQKDKKYTGNTNIKFINNLDVSIWEQIDLSSWKNADGLYVLSPFFNKTPKIIDQIMGSINPKNIEIFTDEQTTTITSTWFKHRVVKEKKMRIYFSEYYDDEIRQDLHGKCIIINKEDKYLVIFGSANFSTQALMRKATAGNTETVIALQLKDADFNPYIYMDPGNNKRRIEEYESTKYAEEDTKNVREYDFLIADAYVEDKYLNVKLKKIDKYVDRKTVNYNIELSFLDKDQTIAKFRGCFPENNVIKVELTESILSKMDNTTTVRVCAKENDNVIGYSNVYFVANPTDEMGIPLLRKRMIEEAVEDSEKFADKLAFLYAYKRENDIVNFLLACEITLDLQKKGTPLWKTRTKFQYKPIQYTITNDKYNYCPQKLLEASLNYIDKHLIKMENSVKKDSNYGGLNKIWDYIFIGTSIVRVIEAHIYRINNEIIHKHEKIIELNDWHEYRNIFKKYAYKLDSLMEFFVERYLERISKVVEEIELKKRLITNNYIYLLNQIRDLISYVEKMHEQNIKILKHNTTRNIYDDLAKISTDLVKNHTHDFKIETWNECDELLKEMEKKV